MGERYVPEEEEEESSSPAPTPAARPAPPALTLSGWGRFGQLPPRRSRASLPGDLQLRMPAFETIAGFARGGAGLSAAQIDRVNRTAEFIARSWTGTSPITSIRVTGYIDRDEGQSDLGQQRAVAVRDALVVALGRQQPGLATRLRWITEDRGLSTLAKVEIYLWAGPTPPPVPPLIRVPSNAGGTHPANSEDRPAFTTAAPLGKPGGLAKSGREFGFNHEPAAGSPITQETNPGRCSCGDQPRVGGVLETNPRSERPAG